MPIALALIPAALAVAGTGLGIAGQQKSQQALSAARSQAAANAKGLQRQSDNIFAKSLAGSTPAVAADDMVKGEQARMSSWNDLKSATTPIASALPATSTTTSNQTGNAQVQGAGGASAWNRLNAKAAARDGSYSDWENQQNIKNANAAQKLSTINNFASGNAELLPTELGVAAQSGDQLSGWGSIVNALGSVAGAAGGVFGGGGINSGQKSSMLNEFNGIGENGMTGSGSSMPSYIRSSPSDIAKYYK